MIYIFEGADLVGKTTTALKFAQERNIPIIKKKMDVFQDREKLKGDTVEMLAQFFFDSIYPLGTHYDFVLDRSLLSSIVYSKFFDRKHDLEYIYKYLLEPELKQYITIYLVCASEEAIASRIITRGEKLFSVDEILEIQKFYLDMADILINQGAPIIKVQNG